MPSMSRFLIITSFSLFLSHLATAQEETPVLVEVDSVEHEHIAQQIFVPGTVVSRYDAEVAAETAGRLHWVADVGDLVEKGGVLAQLDNSRLIYQKAQNEANVSKWHARVNLLDKKLTRMQKMADSKSVSEDQYDEAVSELEIARQELVQAKAELSVTQYQIEQSEVRAPFNALVVSRVQSPGEFTSVGQSIVRVVDPTQIEVTVRAPLSIIPFIEKGMNISIFDRQREQLAPVRAIVPVGDAQSRTMELRVALTPDTFAIGGAVRVALPNSASHKGMTVPRDALVLRKAGAFIFQVSNDGIASQIAVTTGIGMGERIEIFGDVSHGEPVVIRGAERLQPGQKVRIQEAPTLTAASF